MQEQSKKAHLNGKRHAAQAQQDRNTIGSADYKQIDTDNKAKRRSPRIITNNTEEAKVDAALPASHRVSLVQSSSTTSKIILKIKLLLFRSQCDFIINIIFKF